MNDTEICFDTWASWLNSGSEHAKEDIPFFKASDNHLATVSVVAVKK